VHSFMTGELERICSRACDHVCYTLVFGIIALLLYAMLAEPAPPVLCPDPTKPKPIYGGMVRGPFGDYDDACKLALRYPSSYWAHLEHITGYGDHCYTWWTWDAEQCNWAGNVRLHYAAPQCPIPVTWVPLLVPDSMTRPPPMQAPSFHYVQ